MAKTPKNNKKKKTSATIKKKKTAKPSNKKTNKKISKAIQQKADARQVIFSRLSSFSPDSSIGSNSPIKVLEGRAGKFFNLGIKTKEAKHVDSTSPFDGADLARMFTKITGLDLDMNEIQRTPHLEMVFPYKKEYHTVKGKLLKSKTLLGAKVYLLSRMSGLQSANSIVNSGSLLGTTNPTEVRQIAEAIKALNSAVKHPNSHIDRTKYYVARDHLNKLLNDFGAAIHPHVNVSSSGKQKRTQAIVHVEALPPNRVIQQEYFQKGNLYLYGFHLKKTSFTDSNFALAVETEVERTLRLGGALHPTNTADFPVRREYGMSAPRHRRSVELMTAGLENLQKEQQDYLDAMHGRTPGRTLQVNLPAAQPMQVTLQPPVNAQIPVVQAFAPNAPLQSALPNIPSVWSTTGMPNPMAPTGNLPPPQPMQASPIRRRSTRNTRGKKPSGKKPPGKGGFIKKKTRRKR